MTPPDYAIDKIHKGHLRRSARADSFSPPYYDNLSVSRITFGGLATISRDKVAPFLPRIRFITGDCELLV